MVARIDANNETLGSSVCVFFVFVLSTWHCNVYDETLLVENPNRILHQNLFLIFGIHFEFEFASNFENGPEFVFTVLYFAKWHNWFA